jgi:hypothetical protein
MPQIALFPEASSKKILSSMAVIRAASMMMMLARDLAQIKTGQRRRYQGRIKFLLHKVGSVQDCAWAGDAHAA